MSKKRPLPAWMKAVREGEGKVTIKEPSGSDSNSLRKNDNRSSVSHNPDITEKRVEDESDGDCKSAPPKSNPSSTNTNSTSNKLSASQILSESMPFLTFDGTVIYSYQYSDCSCICQDIISSLKDSEKTLVSFDMEWPVSFQQGSTNKTALIQMCLANKTCYLFHVAAMSKFPSPLKDLILDPRLILTGVNVETDLWKLERDFDIRVKPVIDRKAIVDLSKLANSKLKSCERWDLDGLCRNVLRQRLNKDKQLRCGDWSEFPLSKQQKDYAAADAYAGLLLYWKLTDK